MNHFVLWRLAGPMILSNISIALLGMVDTAVVGHLEHAYYLGGLAVGAVIFDFLYWSMNCLRMSTTGATAQACGTPSNEASSTILVQSLLGALATAVVMLVLQEFIVDIALQLLDGSAEVKYYARLYFVWAIWGAPAVLSIMVISGWLLGRQNAIAVLVIVVTVNIVNILLDLVFVIGLEMDVRGVALATVIAVYTGLLLGLWLVIRELKQDRGDWCWRNLCNWQQLKHILALNHDIFIRTLCLIFVFAFFTRQGARQGDTLLAANAVLLNFQMLMALGLDGFANAAEVLVGRAIGGGNRRAFAQSVAIATKYSAAVAILYALTFALAGQAIINILTDIEAIRLEAYRYLPWLIFSPLVSVWCFVLDGIFIGATQTAAMRNSMVVSTFLAFLPAWYLLYDYGNHGLWAAFMIFFIARGLSLGLMSFNIERHGGFVPMR